MNAHPSLSLTARDPRILLLAATLCACGIETEPVLNSNRAGSSADAGTDAGDAGEGAAGTGNAGRGGRAGTSGGKAGEDGKAGSGNAEAGSSGEGASGSDGSAGSDVPECDEGAAPKDEPCLIADDYAVFVSAEGVAGAAGTKESPLPTISAGIAQAVSSGLKRVIVCADAYAEAVEISAGVSVYGGFSCDDEEWEYSGGATVVQPASPGEALKIVDVEDPVLIQDLEFEAKDAVGAGSSSIAGVVKGSASVMLKGVKLKAGKGVDGADGVLEPFTFPKIRLNTDATLGEDECADPATMCLAGKHADGNNGGGDRLGMCPDGSSSIGGFGGRNAPAGAEPGDNGSPDYAVPNAGLGGEGGSDGCSSGKNGAAGTARPAAAGATTLGSIADGAWTPAAGADGAAGQVGQGGGGGGARSSGDPGGGGGGGAGGCGGAGGGGGQGGGASIALLIDHATVTVLGGELRASNAGKGGKGVVGQDGMAQGGIGGLGHQQGCPGGNGGAGGKGGAGGGGAGGLSAGVVWSGTEPAIEDATYELGTAGEAGQGADDSVTTDEGIAGEAREALEV